MKIARQCPWRLGRIRQTAGQSEACTLDRRKTTENEAQCENFMFSCVFNLLQLHAEEEVYVGFERDQDVFILLLVTGGLLSWQPAR